MCGTWFASKGDVATWLCFGLPKSMTERNVVKSRCLETSIRQRVADYVMFGNEYIIISNSSNYRDQHEGVCQRSTSCYSQECFSSFVCMTSVQFCFSYFLDFEMRFVRIVTSPQNETVGLDWLPNLSVGSITAQRWHRSGCFQISTSSATVVIWEGLLDLVLRFSVTVEREGGGGEREREREILKYVSVLLCTFGSTRVTHEPM